MVQHVQDRLKLFSPLTELWAKHVAPGAESIAPAALPEPQRSLLVHEEDMTRRLERHHGQKMTLRVLSKQVKAGSLIREVELRGERDGLLAELGAIRINLECFEDEPKQLILECKRPLGGILADYNIPFLSRPQAYFRLEPTAAVRAAVDTASESWLYGRCNRLSAADGRVIADVIEILPPNR
jgi:hypothetical protein